MRHGPVTVQAPNSDEGFRRLARGSQLPGRDGLLEIHAITVGGFPSTRRMARTNGVTAGIHFKQFNVKAHA